MSIHPSPVKATRIEVWDLPVRLFHWLLVFCFAGAFLTSEQDAWRAVHVTLGYTAAGLVLFRLIWGLVGGRYARFSQFVRGPGAVLRYLRTLLSGQPEHHTGHNPAGAWAILALLAGVLAVTASGWALYTEQGGEWLEELHEALAEGLLVVVGLHVAGVLISSILHKESLVSAMVTGRKRGDPSEAATQGRVPRMLGALILVAVLGFWWSQWRAETQAPGSGGRDAAHAALTKGDDHHDTQPHQKDKTKDDDDDD
jgi:cytochrome b